MVCVKRVYEAPAPSDGCRVLVDRLWPRGLSNTRAKVDVWLREVAPSDALRRWFSHDPKKWPEFRRKYHTELRNKGALLRRLRQLQRHQGTITLLYAASDTIRNNASVLATLLGRGRKLWRRSR